MSEEPRYPIAFSHAATTFVKSSAVEPNKAYCSHEAYATISDLVDTNRSLRALLNVASEIIERNRPRSSASNYWELYQEWDRLKMKAT